MKKQNITYKDSGVDIDKGDELVDRIKKMVKKTYGDRVYQGVGGFACLYEQGDRYLAAGTDGVGTKILLAQQLGIHDTVGIDLVAMCVNDTLCTGAQPLFFMDYLATGKLDVEVSESLVKGVVEGCLQCESALIGGETAEMPGLYSENEYDMAGFAVGEVKKEDVLDGSKIKDGDTIIGLPSSGFHSNGFSLVRKLISDNETELKKGALTPTKIYWKAVKPLLESKSVSALAHITGGGFSNISRVNENFDFNIKKVPSISDMPWFMQDIIERLDISKEDLYTTFNMGVGMVLITSDPDTVKSQLDKSGEKWLDMGIVEKGTGKVNVNVEGQTIVL
ncbi:MAG: phosphoribosylformylglycinamidine cyclo-ligase [Bacteriovoracaceae bacterium]|nr:phosphoribosylformylglycinamidine cyclo-ligase [Bacteriovoracaceae bacterium]